MKCLCPFLSLFCQRGKRSYKTYSQCSRRFAPCEPFKPPGEAGRSRGEQLAQVNISRQCSHDQRGHYLGRHLQCAKWISHLFPPGYERRSRRYSVTWLSHSEARVLMRLERKATLLLFCVCLRCRPAWQRVRRRMAGRAGAQLLVTPWEIKARFSHAVCEMVIVPLLLWLF